MTKILIIEDNADIRENTVELLELSGYLVDKASDGIEGVRLAKLSTPDIVICDIMMPRLDGYQTCALIKHNKIFRSIPVIMLSSKDGLFDRARGMLAGANAYLTKPFTRDELLSAIRQFVPQLKA